MKKLNLLKSKKGMTLVEMIGSLVIISILAVFLLTVFASAINIVGKQAGDKKTNADSAARLENEISGFGDLNPEHPVETTEGSLQIDFGGTVVKRDGKYYKSTDEEGDYTYYYFLHD